MEKVRVALEFLKKYHFWILLVLIVLITFGTWYKATVDRADDFSKGKSTIEGSFSQVGQVTAFKDHPNDIYVKALDLRVTGDVANAPDEVKKIAAITAATESLTGNVSKAAALLFDGQRATFKLPPVFPNNPAQQARFEDDFWKVWNHRIEDIEKPPAEAANKEQYELDRQYRLQYRDQIKEYFPDLFKRIDLRTPVDSRNNPVAEVRGPRSPAVAVDPTKQYTGVLDWPGSDDIIKRFEVWIDAPTTIQVMLAQEDLWVYEALLNVIHNTNNCAKGNEKNYVPPASHKEAPIKKIEALEIGSEAAQSWAACENAVFTFPDGSGGTGATATTAPQQMPMRGAGRGDPGYLKSPLTASGGSAGTLLAGRYVDNSGKPVADLKEDPNKEFRMMPIDLKVVIEQKAIPRLLVECANSNLRIDVRAVRILAETPPAFDVNSNGGGTDAAATATPPAMGRAPERGLRSMGGFRAHNMMNQLPGPGAKNSGANDEEESADPKAQPVLVEIQGIIYIYNPPTTQNTNGQATARSPATSPAPAATAAPGAAAPSPTTPAAPAPATPTAPVPATPTAPVPATPAAPAPAAPAPAAITAPGPATPPNNTQRK